MRRFLINLLAFLSPIIFLIIIPTCIFWKSNESFFNIDNLIAGNQKYFIGYSYNEESYGYLKWADLNLHKKRQIWSLGSSRVLSFRSNMFDSSFYNAGFTIVSINDFRPFLKSVSSDKYPQYLIISLDQWMFNETWDNLKKTPSTDFWKTSFKFYPQPSFYKAFYQDLVKMRFNFDSLSNNAPITKVGLRARESNIGYRSDGSMYYGGQITKLINKDKTARDFGYADTYERIKNGDKRFEFGNDVNLGAVAELDRLLSFCKENNIEVVAFLPPYAKKVYNKMLETKKYAYIDKIYPLVRPVFDKYKFELYNFTDIANCNSGDNETIDGFHGGEKTYQKILISMLDSGSVLNKVAQSKKIKSDLEKSTNDYLIYGY